MSDDDDTPEFDDDNAGNAATVSAVDPVANREHRKREQRERAEGLAWWATGLGSPVGRREIWRMLRVHSLFDAEFGMAGGIPHPQATWFAEGEHRYRLRIYLGLLRDHRELVGLMHDENDAGFAKPRVRKPPAPKPDVM